MCQRGFSRQPVWIHLAGGSRSIARVHACSDIGRAGFSRKSRSWKERLRERTVRGARHSGCICIRRAWNVDVRTREGRKCRSIFSNGVIFAVLNIHKTMICALLSLRCSHFPVRFIFSFACFFSSFFFFFFFFYTYPLAIFVRQSIDIAFTAPRSTLRLNYLSVVQYTFNVVTVYHN